MNQTTRQRITGTLVLAVAALVLLPVIFDGEGSYQPSVQPDIPARPVQPQAALQDPRRPQISADSDAIRIRPETPATVIIGSDNNPETMPADTDSESVPSDTTSTDSAETPAESESVASSTSAPDSTSSQTSPGPQTSPAPTPTVSSSSSAPAALDVQGLPEGWSVRLGSFSNTENASNLVTRLQDAGHRAYTRRIESSQGMLTAVFVGPQVDRATAQTLMERLRQDFQLNGMIVRYEIEEL